MGLFDWLRTAPRQRDAPQKLYDLVAELRVDMGELQRETAAIHESALKTLRKLAKRAEREGDCGCKDRAGENGAPQGERPMSIREARARYGMHGGI